MLVSSYWLRVKFFKFISHYYQIFPNYTFSTIDGCSSRRLTLYYSVCSDPKTWKWLVILMPIWICTFFCSLLLEWDRNSRIIIYSRSTKTSFKFFYNWQAGKLPVAWNCLKKNLFFPTCPIRKTATSPDFSPSKIFVFMQKAIKVFLYGENFVECNFLIFCRAWNLRELYYKVPMIEIYLAQFSSIRQWISRSYFSIRYIYSNMQLRFIKAEPYLAKLQL